MKYSIFSLFFVLAIVAWAQDWDAKFEEVCKRDQFCRRLKDTDGTWFKPKKDIMALLKQEEIQNEIKLVSSKYGINSTAVAGAIVAENSLNVGVKDSVQTWLAGKMGITKLGNKDFSFGLGQIKVEAAMEAEEHIAKIENRKPRSYEELTKEISDPLGSIRVAGMIVRQVQDDYKAQGFDISKDPGLLTTLYNLGKSKQRAADAKREGRTPKINYFGLFVEKHTSEIYNVAKLNTPPTQIKTAGSDAGDSQGSTRKAASIFGGLGTRPVKMDYVTKSLPLVSAPLLCDSADYGQNVAQETMSSSFGAPVAVIDKGKSFSEVSRTLDCNSDVWKMIKSSDGKVGWVHEEHLNQAKAQRLSAALKCGSTPEESSCKSNIEKTAGKTVINGAGTDGLVYLKPVTGASKEDKKITFKNEDFQCGHQLPETEDRKSKYSIGHRKKKARRDPVLSIADMKKQTSDQLEMIDKELKRMSATVKVPVEDLTGPENPYAQIAEQLEYHKKITKSCANTLETETINCQELMSRELQKYYSQIEYKKEPSVSEIGSLNRGVQSLGGMRWGGGGGREYTMGVYEATESEVASTSAQDLKESLEDCLKRLDTVKEKAQAKASKGGGSPSNPPAGYSSGLPFAGGNMSGNMGMPVAVIPPGWGGGWSPYNMQGTKGISDVLKKASADEIKEYAPEFLTFAKFCHAKMNMISKNEKPQNKINCTQAPNYVKNQFQNFKKDVVAKLYEQEPSQLVNEIESSSQMMISGDAINKLLGVAPPPPPQMMNGRNSEIMDALAYCPNKTAEFIEDLLKKNPCIKRVYVPTRYLANKLNAFKDRVIYRTFEDDGKYAVEYGDAACKK